MDKPVVLIPKSFSEGSISADKFVISAEPVMTDDHNLSCALDGQDYVTEKTELMVLLLKLLAIMCSCTSNCWSTGGYTLFSDKSLCINK